tara:strand:+ start:1963 stop:3090 length:1128 start_codon:yes stop_codon:yes gene_type:complete
MLISEVDGLNRINEFCHLYQGKRILLVTGKKSYETSGAKEVLKRKLKNERVEHFSDFSINPKFSDAIRGANIARLASVEVIIAVGGGSVLDMAKLIKAFIPTDAKMGLQMVEGKMPVIDCGLPIIAIPTTSGSGSEATQFAVVYVNSIKFSLSSPVLAPNAIILDGRLSMSGNDYQITCNALDAMAQAIESSWAIGSTTDSRSYAFQALEKGWNIVPRIIGKSRDAMLFQQMVEAANLAGRAINISKTTASHAWSYAFTTHHNIPHGHAVWLTLPAIFQAHLNASDDEIIDTRGVKYFRRLMQKIAELIDPEILSCPEKILKDFLVTIGIEHEFNELGLTSQDQRKFISSQVNIERMANHPVNLLRHTNKIFNIL